MPEEIADGVPTGVRKARLSDVPALARVLASAFHDDPVMNWVARPDNRRFVALQGFYHWYLRANIVRLGEVMTVASLDACAAWEPPEILGKNPSVLQRLRLLPEMIRMASLPRLPRLVRLSRLIQRHHPVAQPHYYLTLIGVLPERQGRGLGKSLLGATLARLDRDRLPAYLENTNARNIGLYERFGFHPVAELTLAPDAPKIVCMWRPPGNPPGDSI